MKPSEPTASHRTRRTDITYTNFTHNHAILAKTAFRTFSRRNATDQGAAAAALHPPSLRGIFSQWILGSYARNKQKRGEGAAAALFSGRAHSRRECTPKFGTMSSNRRRGWENITSKIDTISRAPGTTRIALKTMDILGRAELFAHIPRLYSYPISDGSCHGIGQNSRSRRHAPSCLTIDASGLSFLSPASTRTIRHDMIRCYAD